jgi:hypothetical protein
MIGSGISFIFFFQFQLIFMGFLQFGLISFFLLLVRPKIRAIKLGCPWVLSSSAGKTSQRANVAMLSVIMNLFFLFLFPRWIKIEISKQLM